MVLRRTYDRVGATGAAAVELVTRICAELVDAAERPLLGIGIASPGIIDADGVVVTAAHLGWQPSCRCGPTSRPSSRSRSPSSTTPTPRRWPSSTFGEGTATNLIYVRVDEGVGAGLVLDGRLFTGSSGAAGEIGHVVVDPDGAIVRVRQAGLPGDRGLRPTAQPAARRPTPATGPAILDRAGEHLGIALATVVSALDVTDVVLSGSDPVTTETFRAAAARAIAARTLPVIAERLVVRASTFAFDDAVIGAAARVLDLELGIR